MDDIIKLIDISLEDGRLSQDDYRIILKKAEGKGISEEEFNLILSKRSMKPESKNKVSVNESRSNLPYIIAIIAIALTFMDWIGFYSRASVMGSSGSWDTSFSGWWGGYGISVIAIYAIGVYFYSKGNRLYWLAGVLAIADAFYIYSTIANSDFSYSYNYQGYGSSGEAGYELLWGFWAFILASSIFSLSALFISKGSTAPRVGIAKRFKLNFKSGWKVVGITLIISIFVYTLLFIQDESFGLSLTMASVISLIISLVTILSYAFSSSIRTAGYFLFLIGIMSLAGVHLFIKNRFFLDDFTYMFISFMIYPMCYIILEKFMPTHYYTTGKKIALFAALTFAVFNIGCFEQPKSKFKIENNNINGTYSAESGGVESSLTIIGNSWYGTHTETSFGNLISSGSGTVEGTKLFNQYGAEIGNVSNGTAYVNLGGTHISLNKN